MRRHGGGKQGNACARRLFEPYLVQIMIKLLERFGDVSAAVRAANDALARAVMANLSSQGACSFPRSHISTPQAARCTSRLWS